jgi:hypothetical protein
MSIVKPPYGAMVNPHRASAANLVGAWILNEGLGISAHDASGNGNHGVITPGAGGWTTDAYGPAYLFDGAATKIVVPDSVSLDTASAAFTVAVVGAPSSIAAGRFFKKRNTYAIDLYFGGAVYAYLNGTAGALSRGSTLAPLVNGAIQLFGVKWTAGGSISMFLNSTVETQPGTLAGAVADNTTDLYIGTYAASSFYAGTMSSIYFWSGELSSAIIAALALNPFDPFIPDEHPIVGFH